MKALSLLEKPGRFPGCHKDVSGLQKSFASSCEYYAFQLLSDRSYLAGEDQLKDSAACIAGCSENQNVEEIVEQVECPIRSAAYTGFSGACSVIPLHFAAPSLCDGSCAPFALYRVFAAVEREGGESDVD